MIARMLVVAALAAGLMVPGPVASAQLPGICTVFVPPSISPGQTITKDCLVYTSGSLTDETAWTFVRQDSVRVFDEGNQEVSRDDPDWETYVGFFRLSVSTQRVLVAGDPGDGEAGDLDLAPLPGAVRPYRPVCVDRELTDLTGGETAEELDADGCRIGRIRAVGTPYQVRAYTVSLTMLDEGNQSRFAGWGIQWSEIQRHVIPAVRDCGEAWTCDGGPAPGTYER